MVYGLCPDRGSKCKVDSQYLLEENWRNLQGIPSGRCKRDLHKERLLSETTEDRERAGEQVEGREGDCGELFTAELLGVVGLNRCVAAFTRAREAQFHKHP